MESPGKKTTSTKPGTKSSGTKSTNTKPSDTKPTNTKATGTKSSGKSSSRSKSTDTKSTAPKSTGTRPSGTKPSDTRSTKTKSPGTKPTGSKSTSSKSTDTRSTYTNPTGTKPTGTSSSVTKPTDTKSQSRVRKHTSEKINREIDQKVLDHVSKYRNYSKEEITARLEKLKKEWDIERTLEVNASSITIAGILLGGFVNKKWLILPGIIAGFLLQHGLQGWCPPLPMFRAMGIRTRHEIDEELYALKILRGDFDTITSESLPSDIIESLRSD